MSRRAAAAALVAACGAVVGVPAPAAAHLVTTGLGPFYDGLGHLALTPEDWIAVLAVALFVGLRGKAHSRAALLILPAAWLVGGWVGVALEAAVVPVGGVVSLLVLGALVASDVRWGRPMTVALAAAVGCLHGYLNGGAMASTTAGWLAVVGIVTAVFILVTLVAAFVTRLQAPWTRIAVRVAGSWIAAVGLLMLGWWMRGTLG